jgi:hypothetical protein
MKILMFAVSVFLSVGILNAGDMEKIINESSSTEKNNNTKVEIIKSSTALFGKSNSLVPKTVDGKIVLSSTTLKSKPKAEKKKFKISTIAELRKKQNMEIVELKKKQNKEIKAFEDDSKARIKIKSEYRKVMKDLKLKHRAEQMEFKKIHPLKKDSQKGKQVEGKKKGSKVNQNKKENK